MSLICQKCLSSRSGDVLGAPCRTPGCDGVIETAPEYHDLVEAMSEPLSCPRRLQEQGPWEHGEGLDRWHKFKKNGDRVCSFCGSLHPEDFARLVKEAAAAPEDAAFGSTTMVEPSTKNYKVYINRPSVRNAYEGGIKFYTMHLDEPSQELKDDYALAVRKFRAAMVKAHGQ